MFTEAKKLTDEELSTVTGGVVWFKSYAPAGRNAGRPGYASAPFVNFPGHDVADPQFQDPSRQGTFRFG